MDGIEYLIKGHIIEDASIIKDEELPIWDVALKSKFRLKMSNFPEMREQIIDTAYGYKHLDIWLIIFKDDKDMLKRLNAIVDDENYEEE